VQIIDRERDIPSGHPKEPVKTLYWTAVRASVADASISVLRPNPEWLVM
jgi:hypothetical protein